MPLTRKWTNVIINHIHDLITSLNIITSGAET